MLHELKFHACCSYNGYTISKVNKLLGIIRKSFISFDVSTFPYLYTALIAIRLVIEYGMGTFLST